MSFHRIVAAAALASALFTGAAQGAPSSEASVAAVEHARVVAHWTPERRAAAIPRDLYKDSRGQGYLRGPNGTLIPYGQLVAANGATPAAAQPMAAATVSNVDPAAGATIGASYTFKATVVDTDGIRSVSFKVQKVGSRAQSFTPTTTGGGVYTTTLSGFTDGNWSWWVVVKDVTNTTYTSPAVAFTVSTSGGGGGGGGGGTGNVVTNSNWGTTTGALQRAAGRIYFEMPSNAKRTRWVGYVCSGTVVSDGTANRSIIQTAAHCVYDDANKAFARNVIFIPDQDGTTSGATDRDCSNDPIGCWTTSFGVVDVEYTTRAFPDNSQWDYAYYVVADTGAHTAGRTSAPDALDSAATPITVSFAAPAVGTADSSDYTYGMGYSYSDDPNFMYCAEDMGTQGSINWWLPSCGLSGGSSGGPWMQNMTVNNGAQSGGVLMSVNSWGYTNQPGMAGPKLNDGQSTASCVFATAKSGNVASNAGDGNKGIATTCAQP